MFLDDAALNSKILIYLSLNNAFNIEDVSNFEKSIKDYLKIPYEEILYYSAEPKIDGLSLSITYERGSFSYALTRGNGFEGEDVSKNALFIEGIPHNLLGDFPEILQVRGEVYMEKQTILIW